MPRTLEDYQTDIEDGPQPASNVEPIRRDEERRGVSVEENAVAARLRSFIERIERIDEEIEASREDRKAILAEAAAQGFDKKTLNTVVKIRNNTEQAREQWALVETYCRNLGIQLSLDM